MLALKLLTSEPLMIGEATIRITRPGRKRSEVVIDAPRHVAIVRGTAKATSPRTEPCDVCPRRRALEVQLAILVEAIDGDGNMLDLRTAVESSKRLLAGGGMDTTVPKMLTEGRK